MVTNEYMLTTIDNPYNPFEQFTLWYLFDKEKGYNTSERLARLANITSDMSQKEINEAMDSAMDKLIEIDFLNIYKRISSNETNNSESITEEADE